MRVSVLSLMIGLAACGQPARAEDREIGARHWFNNPVYRLHDDRRVVLFFFRCDDKASARWTSDLNRLSRRSDLVIIGLTSDDRQAAERFMSRCKVCFTVGAESRSAKLFGVERLPALFAVNRNDRDQVQPVDLLDIQDLLATMGGEPPDRELSEIDSAEELKRYIETVSHGDKRESAVCKLWDLLGSEDADGFIEFAERRLPVEPDPFVRGELRYWRNIAQGIEQHDRERSPSSTHFVAFRDNPDAPEWAAARAFRDSKEQRSAAKLLEEYRGRLDDEPNNVLIRDFVVRELHRFKDRADREQARAALMEIVAEDPDRSIRLYAVGGLGHICDIGDTEAADYLDAIAEDEPYVLVVRPAMEYTANYLRTGEE